MNNLDNNFTNENKSQINKNNNINIHKNNENIHIINNS